MEDNDTVDQSVESNSQTSDTPVAEESAPQAEASGAEEQVRTPEKTQEEKPAPFHEHPRFQELIAKNRAAEEREQRYQQDMYRLQAQLETLKQQSTPKKEEPKDPFLADLEKVNPAYAKSFQAVMDRANKAEAIEQRLQQYEQQQFAEKAVSHFNGLLESSKISDPLDRKIYERSIRAEVYEREARGEKLGIKDLDKIFTEFHSEYAKAMEERNRKLTASYVQEKSKDKTPKNTTGLPASPGAKKLAANDFAGQAKWLAEQIKGLKKEH